MKNITKVLWINNIIIALTLLILTTDCKKKEEPTLPILSTTSVSSITTTASTSGGNITSDGNVTVTARGVCWSTTASPTVSLSTKTSDGTGSGTFTSNLTGLSAGNTYHVRAFATNAIGTAYGNDVTFTTSAILPSVSTVAVYSITATSANSGGIITSDGGGSVTARGVCWSTSANPTTALTTKTSDGTGTGVFTSRFTGITANTTYYVRAYAKNSAGTAYGTEVNFTTSSTVTDIEGNIYNTVTIGTQTWMAENLKTTKYNDGTTIPLVTDNTAWSNLTTPGYCLYSNNAANKDTYGALYNWYTVNIGKLCLAGWHMPTDAEWTTLENYLIANGFNYDGTTTGNKIAKAMASTTLWTSSANTGTIGNTDFPAKRNATGFTALPGGFRDFKGSYFNVGISGATCVLASSDAWFRLMYYNNPEVIVVSSNKQYGFSVRCLRD